MGARTPMAPQPGTFLHPVGRYRYALEVLQVWPTVWDDGRTGLPKVQFRRWGSKDGRPFDDGHVSNSTATHPIHYLRYRGPGCWSEPAWYPDDYRYGFVLYREVPGPSGQLALFGAAQ